MNYDFDNPGPTSVVRSFRVTATLTTPSHIGGVVDPLSARDNPIAKVGGNVCIPGPSLKGALREQLDRYLLALFRKNGDWVDDQLKPCIPSTQQTISSDERTLDGAYRLSGCQYRVGCHKPICPCCYVLGALGLVGFVSVPFLVSDAGDAELYSSRLDRATRIAATGTNRPYQLVPHEAAFTGVLQVTMEDRLRGWTFGRPRPVANGALDKWLQPLEEMEPEVFLKAFVLDRLRQIDRIGGYASKGFGRVRIEVVDDDKKSGDQPGGR